MIKMAISNIDNICKTDICQSIMFVINILYAYIYARIHTHVRAYTEIEREIHIDIDITEQKDNTFSMLRRWTKN
jgi:hypothetical protein